MNNYQRVDGRKYDELRELSIIPDYSRYAEGSALLSMGNTRVLCNVTIEDSLPQWMVRQGVPGGWLTGEYAMLPRSTHQRTPRENRGYRGRTMEIRRLIGRSLRAAVNLELLGHRTCIIDCDVIQADGGTRTAAINGGYVALVLALRKLIHSGEIPADTIVREIAAISVGMIDNAPILDLCYEEDSLADVDSNIVMDGKGNFIEIQGTAEKVPYSRDNLEQMLKLAQKGIKTIQDIQRAILSIASLDS